MRRLLLLFAVFMLLAFDSPRDYDDAVALERLEGTWSKVEVVYSGQNLGRSGHLFLIVGNGRFTWQGGGEATTGTYKVDPATKPARTEQLPTSGPGAGKTWRMIYQVNGDTLTIAYKLVISEYPSGFDDKDAFVTTMKRVK